MEEYEKCDSCGKLLILSLNEDYFEETENGSYVFCEKCWLEYKQQNKNALKGRRRY